MRKSLLTYVKPHVQEDPLSMILGITYIGAMMEQEGLPVELCDERLYGDAHMREVIDRNDIIGFGALTPNIRRAIAWAKYAKEQGYKMMQDREMLDKEEEIEGLKRQVPR